jgi:hypothetical protein
MNLTEEAKTLPPEMQRWVRLARIAVGIIAGAVVTIGSAITTYRVAADEVKTRTQAVKDKSEAGYQVTKEAVADLDKRIAELERVVRQLAAQQHPPARRGSKPRALPPPPQPAPAPKALPPDLDQAQRQVYKGAPLAPAPVMDGGTKRGQ